MVGQNIILNYRRSFDGLFELPVHTKTAEKYIKNIDLYLNSEELKNSLTLFLPFEELLSKSKNSELIQNVFKSDFKDI